MSLTYKNTRLLVDAPSQNITVYGRQIIVQIGLQRLGTFNTGNPLIYQQSDLVVTINNVQYPFSFYFWQNGLGQNEFELRPQNGYQFCIDNPNNEPVRITAMADIVAGFSTSPDPIVNYLANLNVNVIEIG